MNCFYLGHKYRMLHKYSTIFNEAKFLYLIIYIPTSTMVVDACSIAIEVPGANQFDTKNIEVSFYRNFLSKTQPFWI